MAGPWSLALTDDGEELAIVIVDNHYVRIFSADGKYLREFGSKGTGNGELFFPVGVVSHEGRILVSDNPGVYGRIQEFGIDGTYLRTIYKRDGMGLTGMCIADNHIACLHHNSFQASIKLFAKQTGELVQEIGIPIDCPINVRPVFLAYENGKYFVSCLQKNCICVFDENGVFLYKFGESGKRDGQFDGVCGLAVYGADMILVCDGNNDRVQVFSLEGDFISSFGSYGSRLGQMNRPIDVAVTLDV